MSQSGQSEPIKVRFSNVERINLYPDDDHDEEQSTTKFGLHSLKCKAQLFVCIITSFPFLNWIPEYQCKTDLLRDFAAGMTVAVMHIPHGLAYVTLANVPPVHGIYMAVFPVVIYTIFCTSKHISVGTFAVICLMTGEVVNDNIKYRYIKHGINATNISGINKTLEYTAIEVGTIVSLTVGLWHLLLFCLRFGIVCSVLSGTFISSFTCGASIHVFTSQVRELLGIRIKNHYGKFGLFYQYYDIILNIPKTSLKTFAMSSASITCLSVFKFGIVPLLQKRTKLRLPFELIIILIANGLSIYLHLQRHGIRIVEEIPSGFPSIKLPPFSLFIEVIEASFFITVVSYSVSMSMATMFATALNYDIDGNQELLAYGLANIFGSFLQCLPVSASLSRSIIQEITGGKSQIASVISCLILSVVLLWIGPFFETVPRCVLAAVVVVSLTKMYLQVKDVPKIWKLSKLEAIVWVGTFLSVVLLDVKSGLIIGLVLTMIHVFIESMKPNVKLLGVIMIPAETQNNGTSNEIVIVDIDENHAVEITGIKIICVSEGLIFATMNHIKNQIYFLSGINPQEVLKTKKRMNRKKFPPEDIEEMEELMTTVNFKLQDLVSNGEESTGIIIKRDKLRHIIIDMKSIKYIDRSGINLMETIIKYYNEINITVHIISNYKQLSSDESIQELLKNIGN